MPQRTEKTQLLAKLKDIHYRQKMATEQTKTSSSLAYQDSQ